MKILIYGANGYTGKLIVDKAIKQNLNFVISGRNESKITEIANDKKIPFFIASHKSFLQNPKLLDNFDIFLNCAGPFSKTAKPIMQACIKSKTHYLDITGEIEVFQLGKLFNSEAQSSNIIICPGVGFDVIPTDCLAAALNEKLPNADELILGFESTTKKMSPGTMSTSIESLGKGGKICKNGNVINVPLAFNSQQLDFGNGLKTMVTIPWGDVVTAGYSTGIKNISVFIPMSEEQINRLKLLSKFSWLLKTQFLQNFMKNKVKKNIKGPSFEEREKGKTFVWGQIHKGHEIFEGKITTKNGYDVTVDGSLAIIQHINNNKINGGYYTPSQLCGFDLIEKLSGSSKIKINKLNK
jgi:short subunit dehydrogenase-like uncharacterized protein